ncbi:MAG TPA: peptidoglycan recognition family protein [Rubrobacteraceae bacterium]|nr:peptidoglycan recognition family protein [Rubrobacteraceae bacterium]
MYSEDLRWKIDRRDFLRLGGAGLAGAVLLGTAGKVLAQTGSSLVLEFEAAATEYNVPKELLLAMGYVNTRWEMPPPEASNYEAGDIEGRGYYGIMQLMQNPSRDTLGRAASLTGLSEEELKTNRAANVRGGAAVLADIQGPNKPSDLNGWQETVAGYGDTDLYAIAVYETLKSGASTTTSSGESLELAAQDVEVPQVFTAMAATDYPPALSHPAYSGNYTNSNREASYNIDRIIIHVTQGSYVGAINWFQDPSANVSAHYVVRSKDGRVAQCVRNADIAWHAGNWTYNTHSIGIEHEGYVSQRKWFTRAMYRHSARLAAWCCKRHRIPVDRQHIIGHYQVPGSDHTDPGPYWNWTNYMRLVHYYRRRM